MSTITKFKSLDSKVKYPSTNTHFSSMSNPLRSYGIVNIDNIEDEQYEIIHQLIKDTIDRQVKWRQADLVTMLVSLATKTETTICYFADYKGMNVTISNNFKGIVRIKITTRFTKKVVVDTFIPFKPSIQYGKKIGTSRSFKLYSLFQSVRYQVDGMSVAV